MSDDPNLCTRLVTSFGRFWWDFLVGDTPEITVAVVIIVGAVSLFADVAHVNVLAYVALPVFVVLTLGLSLQRVRKSR